MSDGNTRSNGKEMIQMLKYHSVECLYRLVGWFVLRREKVVLKCTCGYVQNNQYVPSYFGATIFEPAFWKTFQPHCLFCDGDMGKVTVTYISSEPGEALHKLPGYTEHARQGPWVTST